MGTGRNTDLIPKGQLESMREYLENLKELAKTLEQMLPLAKSVAEEMGKIPSGYKEESAVLKSLSESLEKLIELESKRVVQQERAAKSGKEAAEAVKVAAESTKEQTEATKEEIAENKEVERLTRSITRTKAQLTQMTSKLGEENATLRYNRTKGRREQQQDIRLNEAQANSLEGMRAKVAVLTREWVRMDVDSPDFPKKAKEIGELNEKLREVEKTAGIFGRNVGSYKENIISAFKQMGARILGVVTIIRALGKVIKDTIKINREFEQANANLATILGKSRKEIGSLTKSARQLGATTEWTASQVTELQTELARLGNSEKDIKNMQKSILQFATATDASLGSAAALAGSVLNAFQMSSEETERAVSVMTLGANKSALSFEYLNSAMSTVSPVAKAFGFTIEDTVALLGTLADSGFEAGTAATATRNILLNLADANGKLAKRIGEPVRDIPSLIEGLNKLNSEGVDLATTLELTDRRSVAAFNTFLKGTGSLKALRNELDSTSGVLEQIQRERLNTLDGSMKMLKSAWEELMLSFGKSTGVIKGVVDATTWLISGTKDSTTAFGEQLDKVVDLETDTKPLLDRYDELKDKAVLNKDEQVELNKVMNSISDAIPGIVTKFDKYGNVLGVNTEKAREYLKIQQAILRHDNAKAIRKAQGKLVEDRKAMDELIQILKDGSFDASGMGVRTVYLGPSIHTLTPEDRQVLQQRIRELGGQIKETENLLKGLTGSYMEEALERNEIREKFLSMSEDALKKYIDQNADAGDEIVDKAKDTADEVVDVHAKMIDELEEQSSRAPKWQVVQSLPSVLDQGTDITKSSHISKAENLDVAQQVYKQRFGEAGSKGGSTETQDEWERRRKAEKKKQEKLLKQREELLKEGGKKIVDLEVAIVDAEIAAMEEGVEKKLAQASQAATKREEAYLREEKALIAKINEAQQGLSVDSEEYQELEKKKTKIKTLYENLRTQVAADGVRSREKILKSATIEELKEYQKGLDNFEESERVRILIAERGEKELQAKQKSIREDAQKSIGSAEANYYAQQSYISAVVKDEKERKKLAIQNEIYIRRAKAETYMAQLKAMHELGVVDQAEYHQIMTNLATIQSELEELGSSVTKDGRSLLARMFGVKKDDEEGLPEWVDEVANAAFDIASQIGNAIYDAQKQSVDRRLKLELKRIDDQTQSEKKALEDRRNRGLISEKNYQKELERIDNDADKRREESEKRAFEAKKKLDIKAAIMNTALSISKNLAMHELPRGWILAALAAAEGAVQIATIKSQKFARGGLLHNRDISMTQLKGPSHAQGGLRIYLEGSDKPLAELEGDEIVAVLNKRSANRYLPLLSRINEEGGGRKFAEGGLLPYQANWQMPRPAQLPRPGQGYARENYAIQRELAALRADLNNSFEVVNSRIDNIKVHVVESEMTESQESVRATVEQTKF